MKNAFLLLFFIFSIVLSGLQTPLKATERYASETLKIIEITPNVWMHVSYLQTESWGKVGCNGMIFRSENAAIVFDTPTVDSVSEELITWIQEELKCQVVAVVVNHFHEDCLGGLGAFHAAGIPSYGTEQTISLAAAEGYVCPQNSWERKRKLKIGSQKVILRYLGEAHTRDNMVAYVPSEQALFGGCMVKSLKAGKGYLGDANVQTWSGTIRKVKAKFPRLRHVIPGHGKPGDVSLLDYTIDMFHPAPTDKN